MTSRLAARPDYPASTDRPNGSEQGLPCDLYHQAHYGRLIAAVGKGVAQELRNVAQLTAMLCAALKTDHSGLSADLIQAAGLADASLLRQIGILERLGPEERQVQPLEVVGLLEQAVELARQERHQVRMAFILEVAKDLGPVAAVAAEAEEILWELIRNSRQACTERGYGTIRLSAWRQGDRGLISIEDDGPGLDAATVGLLSDAASINSQAAAHCGIGLISAAHLARLNGGSLVADTEVAIGARFLLDLPLGTGLSASLRALI